MKQFGANDQLELHTSNELTTDNNNNNNKSINNTNINSIINNDNDDNNNNNDNDNDDNVDNEPIFDKWSNLTFYDTNLNKTFIHVPHTNLSEMYHFTTSAERLLNNNLQNNSYTMIVFDINLLCDITDAYNHAIFNALIHHVFTTLQACIQEPNLFCRINDDNFAIFVENYKAIDIALSVINLTEEISSYNPELTIKLTFGICPADNSKIDIPSLCRLAFYAKSTLKGQSDRFLANYNELVFHKKMARS